LIREAGANLLKAETEGFKQHLRLAFALGELLNQAKVDPEIPHGKWETWFEDQKFEFSLRKAQQCMRLADYKPELEAWAKTQGPALLAGDHRLTIADAEALIKQLRTAEKQTPSQSQPKPSSSNEDIRAEQTRAETAAEFAEMLKKMKAKAERRRAREQARQEFIARLFKKPEIHSSLRTLLVKALGMLGSEYDAEVLIAARKAEEMRKKLGLTWDDLIVEATQENNRKPGEKNQAQSQH
jgi:hypothetical protein